MIEDSRGGAIIVKVGFRMPKYKYRWVRCWLAFESEASVSRMNRQPVSGPFPLGICAESAE